MKQARQGETMVANWIYPQKFENDSLDYVARIIHATLLVFVAFSLVNWFALAYLVPSAFVRLTMLSLPALTVAGLLMVANRTNPVRAGRLLLVFYGVTFTCSIATSGGVDAPGINAYFILIIISTLAFSLRAGLAMLLATFTAILLMVWMQTAGVLPLPAVAHTPLSSGVIWMQGLAISFAIIGVASHATRGYLRNRHETEARLKDANAALDATVRKLNARVQQLEFVHQSAGISSVVWDLATDEAELFGDIRGVMGLPAGDANQTFHNYVSYLHPDDQPVSLARMRDGLKGLRPRYRARERILLPGGGIRWVEAVGRFEYDASGRAVRMAGALSDVTEQHLAQEVVAQSERRYRGLFDSALDGIAILSAGGILIDVNPACCRETGFARDDVIGRSFADFFPAEDVPGQLVSLANIGKQGSAMAERRLRRKDGKLIPVEINAWLLPDGNVQAVLRNISERKHAQERFARVFQLAPNAIMISKLSDSKIVDVNMAGLGIFGYARDEVIGRTTAELNLLVDPNDRARLFAVLNSSASVRGLEFPLRRKSGELAEVILDADIIEFDGEPHMVVSAIDVTARKRDEAEIRQLNATLEERVRVRTTELQEANRDLESFSYSVSHDLRAPLRSILGYTQILNQDYGPTLPGEGQKLLERVRNSAKRMNELIENLLAFSQIGTGKPKRQRLVDMHAEVAGLVEELDLRGKVEVDDIPKAEGDPSLLRQVWQNLILNAVKFSKNAREPKIHISGERRPDGRVDYTVEDNGVGFDMEYAGKLFGVFQRLHSEREFEGTGVGLAIVHRIIGRHGGQISAHGTPGKGARFTFTLPAGTHTNIS
jgi:PAS domain S-box-containing protein